MGPGTLTTGTRSGIERSKQTTSKQKLVSLMPDAEQTKVLAFAPNKGVFVPNKGIVGGNDDTHYACACACPCPHHHDRAVTRLRFVSLHDGKRGARQISQGTPLLAPRRTLLG
jgi:hypothetical protein